MPVFASLATPGNADFEVPAYQTFSDTLDAGIMPLASGITNVSNTVNYSGVRIYLKYYDMSNSLKTVGYTPTADGRFSFSRPSDFASLFGLQLYLYSSALPSSGKYTMQWNFIMDVGLTWSDFTPPVFYWYKYLKNATGFTNDSSHKGSYTYNFSDYYGQATINLSNLDQLGAMCYGSSPSWPLGGVVKVNFTRLDSSAEVEIDTTGKSNSEDIQTNIADSSSTIASNTSQMVSSIEDMSEGIGEVVAAVENLPSAMEPHFDNVLRQIQHVTDQLHAFWDQWASFMSTDLEPHITLQADRIIEAIENIHIDFGEFSTAIIQNDNKLHQEQLANDNKLHKEQILNDDKNTEEVKDSIEKHGNFIIEGLKSLFIPSDEFFKSYFDDLYEWFNERLGFLMFPVDLIIRIANLFLGSSSVDCVLTLPSFSIEGHQLWAEYSFNLTEFLNTNFKMLVDAIRLVSSIGLVVMFVQYCERKWEEVMAN